VTDANRHLFPLRRETGVRAKIDPVADTGKSSTERVGASVDDATLVRETLAGKRWAEREVWFRFAPMVYGLLRRTLSSKHDYDDLVQEVFLRVYRRLNSLEKVSALRSFVYSVAVRVVSEEIRHFYVLQRIRSELVLVARQESFSQHDFDSRDTLQRIERILEGIEEKHRAVFVLRHVEGMELLDIGAALGISLATVKRYLVRAMRKIQHAVADDEGLRLSLSGVLSAKESRGDDWRKPHPGEGDDRR
jgi:RNA polymerase sigma-70 factor, ECF subfamily